ncbi:MAG: Hsp20/alpha crystallin family protein [Candidatus Falkowbacteria bacterium]|nr:Hsp20/alpha crystallin family protein [Candidatus Falkowbacteria bacterium]
MSIIKWTPNIFEPLGDMDKWLDEVHPDTIKKMNFSPAVDMYEEGDNIIVETQLAGIDPEKVDISIENDVLIIKGESEKTSEVEEKDYYKKEIRRGSFFRSIQLPTHVIGEKASAEAIDGVLKISVPKSEESKKKIIKVKAKIKK